MFMLRQSLFSFLTLFFVQVSSLVGQFVPGFAYPNPAGLPTTGPYGGPVQQWPVRTVTAAARQLAASTRPAAAWLPGWPTAATAIWLPSARRQHQSCTVGRPASHGIYAF